MKILGIIPARYASTRLEGKPLKDIGGKSMIERVYIQASKANLLHKIVVATDDLRISEHIKNFGGNVVMTSPNHPNGTDRCAEALEKIENEFKENFEVVINIQGDEPFINPEQINQIAQVFLTDKKVEIATLAKKIISYEELVDIKEAKIVLNQYQEAIYMSRSAVPFLRNEPIETWHLKADFYKHIGIYGFAKKVLQNISVLIPTLLETQEGLEQLRWLANYRIKVGFTDFETLAIDTEADLELAKKMV
jgi:3-deoxy-manno-octulosonate cytidylyltransferase (CMP-KDO synthetase)